MRRDLMMQLILKEEVNQQKQQTSDERVKGSKSICVTIVCHDVCDCYLVLSIKEESCP